MAKKQKSTIWWKRTGICTAAMVAETAVIAVLNGLKPQILESEVIGNLACLAIIFTALSIGVSACACEILRMEERQQQEEK